MSRGIGDFPQLVEEVRMNCIGLDVHCETVEMWRRERAQRLCNALDRLKEFVDAGGVVASLETYEWCQREN